MDNQYKKQLNSLRIKKAIYLVLLLLCIAFFMFAGFHLCLFIVNMSMSFHPKQPVILHDNNILDFYKLKVFIDSFFEHCKNNLDNYKELPLIISVFITSFFGFGIFTGEFMKAGTLQELKRLKKEQELKEKEKEEKRFEKEQKSKKNKTAENKKTDNSENYSEDLRSAFDINQ